MSGKVICEYLEYLSGIAGAGKVGRPGEGGGIPAFKEALRFLLKEVVVTKATDGLVEISRSLSVMAQNCLISWSILVPCITLSSVEYYFVWFWE